MPSALFPPNVSVVLVVYIITSVLSKVVFAYNQSLGNPCLNPSLGILSNFKQKMLPRNICIYLFHADCEDVFVRHACTMSKPSISEDIIARHIALQQIFKK